MERCLFPAPCQPVGRVSLLGAPGVQTGRRTGSKVFVPVSWSGSDAISVCSPHLVLLAGCKWNGANQAELFKCDCSGWWVGPSAVSVCQWGSALSPFFFHCDGLRMSSSRVISYKSWQVLVIFNKPYLKLMNISIFWLKCVNLQRVHMV